MSLNLENLQPPIPTLHSIVVELGAGDRGHPPATLGRAIHAQVMKWLSFGNPELADRIHEGSTSPLSLSGLLGRRRPKGTQPGDRFLIRIGLLDGSLLSPFLQGIEQWDNTPVILGKFPFALRQVYAVPGTQNLVRSVDYRQLVQATPVQGEINLRFLSPTSFKQQQNIQTFPLPDLVFGSLQRRWNQFAPTELQFPDWQWEGMVSAYDLKTHALRLEGGAEIGTQGWIRYKFRDPEQARIASILAQFAFYAGVGRKTAMGMGQTAINHQSPVASHQ